MEKTRITLLSKKIMIFLQEYFTVFQPKVWVFEGMVGLTVWVAWKRL